MATTKTFGQLQVGDKVLGADGELVSVKSVYDEHCPERMFEITLEDGRTERAGGTHLWYVITDEDWSLFGERKRDIRREMKRLSPSARKLVNEMAEHEVIELSYDGLLKALLVDSDSRMASLLERVVESVGPIVEENHELRDLLDDTLVSTQMVPIYNGALVARQLLSFAGDRKWKKANPPLPGRVVTTEELLSIARFHDVEIPTPKKARRAT